MIKQFDTVIINGKDAIVKEIQEPEITKYPKAIVIQEGQEYSVNVTDLKLKGQANGRN